MKKRTQPIYLGGIGYSDMTLQLFVVKKYNSYCNTVFYLMPTSSEKLISAATHSPTHGLYGQSTYTFTFEELVKKPLAHLSKETFMTI